MPSSTFGNVDRLPSGRWRARYTGPDGLRRGQAFPTKSDARAWLATVSADVTRRAWRAPEAGRRTVGAYAIDYLQRSDLRASTRSLYESPWRNHLAETWEYVPVQDVTPQRVRRWHQSAASSTGPTAVAQSYRLLRSLLNVAVEDGVIGANPCRLPRAASPEPATPARALTLDEVQRLADAMAARYHGLVLVLALGGLRFGEATALHRRDVDGDRLTVARSQRGGILGTPKTAAGMRTVVLPGSVAGELARHLSEHVPTDPDALVFGTTSGRFLARSNASAMFRRAAEKAGLPPTRVHWLRHTGATLAAAVPGVSTKDLQARLGHSTSAAALRYQHAVSERDGDIARALDDMMRSHSGHAPT